MLKELKYVFYLFTIFFFIFFITKYYFSNENIKKSYRSFNSIDKKIKNYTVNLSTLKSDTENIVEYVENNIDQNKKNFQFWELLKNDKK